ncbi:SspB-related isopeptide-forming adhesin [Falseniella ignava]
MFKINETKAYGSIRKMKVGGACGVILALAMLGMSVSTGMVSADEIKSDLSVAKSAEVDVPVSHKALDKAVAEAKEAGVKVEVGAVQDKGVATTDTVAGEQKKIEADYLKQENEVKKATGKYKADKAKNASERKSIQEENKANQEAYEKDVEKHNQEVSRISSENKAILADNAKKQAETEAENSRIERDNASKQADYETKLRNKEAFNKKVEEENDLAKADYEKKLDQYKKDLAVYNKQKEELAKQGLKAEKPNMKVYGDYDESNRGSVNYYKKLTASFEGVEGLVSVKDYIGLHSDSSITASREGLLAKNDNVFAEIVNPKAGDSFTIHNIAETKDGKKVSAKFTFKKVESEWVENGKSLSKTKISIYKNNGSGSLNFGFWNLVEFNPTIEFFYESIKKPVKLAMVNMFNDVDWGQEFHLSYEDGSDGLILNPNGSKVEKVSRNGKNYYKGEYKLAYESDHPSMGVKKGDLYYANVGDESDIPLGSLLSVGYGSKLDFAYHNGFGLRTQGEIDNLRKWYYDKADSEGKPRPSDEEIFSSVDWAVGIFGKASTTVPINILTKPPVKPVLKEKDTKEIPKPVLEKPKVFVPRTTLPLPPKPTPPKEKELPKIPQVPTVKVNYARLRVNPTTPKPVKSIIDNYGKSIDGANTFDKNVKFSLTTDYKPYSTFTADSKAIAKRFAIVDDVQDGAYQVDDSKIKAMDSDGKDVKQLFDMYHVLSDKGRTEAINQILKEAGLNPKGEFYMWVPKDNAAYYKNYVSKGKNITFDLPAKLLVKEGQKVQNDFHQIDFGIDHKSNLVTAQVPDVKPEKHALDQKDDSKIRDGQEIQIGEYIRYLLNGVTVPAKHDTLHQYDGIDMLDTKHDRYTGKWKGVIKGTEYMAERDLTLPYDVVLKDGKVIKAGEKVAKGTSYAFMFEVNQDTNPDFLKKIVSVTWNEKEGKWSYSINKEFLNSLGVKGTFDADFYLEVERIAAGKVENTFINIVNAQEMTAKVITHTPEVPETPESPKPQEPKQPKLQPQLPSTGTASSMLGFVGIGILSMLGLVGVKRKKD